MTRRNMFSLYDIDEHVTPIGATDKIEENIDVLLVKEKLATKGKCKAEISHGGYDIEDDEDLDTLKYMGVFGIFDEVDNLIDIDGTFNADVISLDVDDLSLQEVHILLSDEDINEIKRTCL